MMPPRLGISYFGNRYPGHARKDLEAISATGATIADHVMSEEDLRWNSGTIRTLVEITHHLGMEAWLAPWALGGAFGGEAASYAVMEHPEACQRDSHDSLLPSLCFNQQPFRTLMSAWLDAAAESGADVVTWDEPYIGSAEAPATGASYACHCNTCQELYRSETGDQIPRYWDENVAAFNRSIVQRTIAWLVNEANNRGLQSAIIMFPVEENAAGSWKEMASLPGVAYFGASPYWILQGVEYVAMNDYLRRWCQRITNATDGVPAQSLAWLQAFSIPAGREQENAQGFDIMVEEEIDVIAAWSYRACEAMSALTPANPELVWEVILNSFAKAANH